MREYAYQRVTDMPLVKVADSDDDTKVFIDVSEVIKKYYNGVLIGSADNVAKILTEEYSARVSVGRTEEAHSCISVSCEEPADVLKKTLNRVEAFVSSI